MGASDAQMVMGAGFAGGLGLSGGACGALGAAIWMKTLAWCRDHPGTFAYTNPEANPVLEAFRGATIEQVFCSAITGQRFLTIDEHTEFIKNGGCADLIELLARLEVTSCGEFTWNRLRSLESPDNLTPFLHGDLTMMGLVRVVTA